MLSIFFSKSRFWQRFPKILFFPRISFYEGWNRLKICLRVNNIGFRSQELLNSLKLLNQQNNPKIFENHQKILLIKSCLAQESNPGHHQLIFLNSYPHLRANLPANAVFHEICILMLPLGQIGPPVPGCFLTVVLVLFGSNFSDIYKYFKTSPENQQKSPKSGMIDMQWLF